MKKKTLTIISIVSIIIVSLILLGITYGYFMTKIDGNKNSKSVEVVTGNSKVLYTDLSEDNTSEIIEPSYKTVKVFTVQNTGDVSATYSIYLVDVVNNFSRTQDITYNLYKKEGTITDVTIDTDLSNWTRVNTNENLEFPTEMDVIAADEVIETPNQIYTYVLKIEYINHPTENQNIDQGKKFSFKINLRAESTYTNPYSEGTLAYSILDNGADIKVITGPGTFVEDPTCGYGQECLDNVATGCPGECYAPGTEKYEIKNNKNIDTINVFSTIADGSSWNDETESFTNDGIFKAEDDYGTSYYYRGPIKNNYVSFAGFIWRIVRINGDGSVRIVLNETLDIVKHNGVLVKNNSNLALISSSGTLFFNSIENDNAHVGYMFGSTGQTTYDETHKNINDSTIKTYVDTFYREYLSEYQSYLTDTLFCGDKTRAENSTGGFGNRETSYSSTDRIWGKNDTTPTLECASSENDSDNISEELRAYSRYTSIIDENNYTNKGVLINNDLTYPIALLSTDEVVMAGAHPGYYNSAYYLGDFSNSYSIFTMTPYYIQSSTMWRTLLSTNKSVENFPNPGGEVRPVINVKGNLMVTGEGTEAEPYIIG